MPEDTSTPAASPSETQSASESTPAQNDLASIFQQGLEDYGHIQRSHPNKIEKPAEKSAEVRKPEENAPKEEKAASKDEKPAAPPTQAKLSEGFAKLTRQQRAVARKEAEVLAKEKSLAEAQAQYEKSRTDIRKELELDLLEKDDFVWLEKLASKKGTTRQALLDAWVRRALNGDRAAPEDVAAEAVKKVSELELKLEEARKADSEKEARRLEQAAIESEKQKKEGSVHSFVKFTRESKDYPLLAQQDPSEIMAIAWEVGSQLAQANGKTQSEFAEVAEWMEQQLQYQEWLESRKNPAPDKTESAAKAEKPAAKAEATPTPAKKAEAPAKKGEDEDDEDEEEAPRPRAPNPERVAKVGTPYPKTLTNAQAARRSTDSRPPRNDDERLDRALRHWA